MKSKRRKSLILVRHAFLSTVLSLIFFGCEEKEALSIPENDLNVLITKVEKAYEEGNVKVETDGLQEKETMASWNIQNEVRSRLLAYQKTFESRYHVTRNLSEGYPVGVIPAVDACPAGTEKIKFFMDNQDNGNSMKTGWTGAWTVDANGNTWHTLCSVYGAAFKFMTFNTSTLYLLVRLGNNKTMYMEPRVWNVYLDNEDNNNKNVVAEGDFNPNTMDQNGTNLQFWAIAGKNTPGVNQDSEFPDLGFSYGVFGTFTSPVIGGAAGTGMLKTDDENNSNANQLFSKDWNTNVITHASSVQGKGVDRTNDPGNTIFNIRKVR
ncbi:hypothetical protein [Dyadobacter bucti]|uniref:hypothetical protein n=1 Tax=Dyadobacter bucti TaxID=2572203 RepID=UPI001108F125|nr:hypothetical protein [Dyadobacter bucti]